MLKGYLSTNIDGSIKIEGIKEIANNSGGSRWASSFDDNFAIAHICANGSLSDTYTLIWSDDLWETYHPLYLHSQILSVEQAGAGARHWWKARFGNEDVLIGTGYYVEGESPLRVYRGGNHYYGEIFVEVGVIQANQTKTITVKSGYMMQSPKEQVLGEVIKPIWSLPLNEGMGNTVMDSLGNVFEITGKYVWDSFDNSKRFGNYVPYQKSYTEGSGIKFINYVENGVTKYSGITLGKVIPLERNNNFSIIFDYKIPLQYFKWSEAGAGNIPLFTIGDIEFAENGSVWRINKKV